MKLSQSTITPSILSNVSMLISKALRGLFWAFGVFNYDPLCQLYSDFSEIFSIGEKCDYFYGEILLW